MANKWAAPEVGKPSRLDLAPLNNPQGWRFESLNSLVFRRKLERSGVLLPAVLLKMGRIIQTRGTSRFVRCLIALRKY